MSYIDVAIPLVGGVLLLVAPELFVAKTVPPERRRAAAARFRKIGLMLVGVAALYFALKLAQGK